MLFLVLYWAIRIYRWILIATVLTSWFAPGSNHPVVTFLHKVTEPVLAPIRKVLPPMGGLDLSPIVVFVILYLIERFVLF